MHRAVIALGIAQAICFIAGVRSPHLRRQYPVFLTALLYSTVLCFWYRPFDEWWINYVWVPVEMIAAGLRTLACYEAVYRQRITGLLMAVSMSALFLTCITWFFLPDGMVLNLIQIRRSMQIFPTSMLLIAVIIPRPPGYRRGLHLPLLLLMSLPRMVISLWSIRLATRGSDWGIGWESAFVAVCLLTAIPCSLWVLASLGDNDVNPHLSLLDSAYPPD